LILDKEKTKNIGKVCSGSYSPSLKKCIGMAYVDKDFSKIGRELKVSVRNKDINIKITKMPFIESKYYKNI
jgi:aminomethyltransferase